MRRLLLLLPACMLIFAVQLSWAEEELFDTEAAASYLEKGIENLATKNYQAAVEALEEAAAISPDAEAYYYLGYAYYMKGRAGNRESQKKSIESFDKAYELDPGFTPTKFKLDESFVQQEQKQTESVDPDKPLLDAAGTAKADTSVVEHELP